MPSGNGVFGLAVLTAALAPGCGSEESSTEPRLHAGDAQVGLDAGRPHCGSEDATCADAGAPLVPEGDLVPDVRPTGFLTSVAETAPPENALTEARAQLGKRLFYDPILSRDRSVSCSSCHLQEYGFAEPRQHAQGVDAQVGSRNTPQLSNLAWVRAGLFWDGRAPTLEDLATDPIENPIEMDLRVSKAVARLEQDESYVKAFAEAYDAAPSAQTLAAALASFVRCLVSTESPFDRFVAGDSSAMKSSAQRGFALFTDKAGCFHCHSSTTLTNDGFFNNGTFIEGGDIGRQALTGRTGDLGKFRVPSLRNVAVTAPYMHDGSLATLEDVVEHYARGGNGHPSTDVQLEPLDLSAKEKRDLVAFMTALTDDTFLSDPRLSP